MRAIKYLTRNCDLHFFRTTRAISTRPEVYELRFSPASKEVIEENNHKITKFFTENPRAQPKEFDVIKSRSTVLELARKIIDVDPILKEQIRHIENLDPEVVFAQGVPVSAAISHFPQNNKDLDNPDFRKETLSSLLTISSLAYLFGIETTKPAFIFSQKTAEELVNSNTELPYHNDGWQKHPDQKGSDAYLMLLGIVGNQQALTEVITLRKILETLRESGQEELIEKLSKNHFISFEDFFPVIAPIIDGKTIRFASRAANDFRATSSDSNEATLRLKDHLTTTTPSFKMHIQKGDLVFVSNHKTLHRRSVVTPDPSPTNKPTFEEKRLLTRIIGGKQK